VFKCRHLTGCKQQVKLFLLPVFFVETFTGSKVQGFKVPFSSLGCIWDAHLREKRQFRQVQSKIWSQLGN
jgi:hypothetical protein